MGIIFVGDSVAEEEVKVSTVNHDVKLFPIRVPGEEIHMVASNEEKGISINKEARMEEGRAKFGLNYSLEYICSFTATLRREMIGPLAEGIRVNYHITGGEVDGPKLRGKLRPGGADFANMRRDGVGLLDIRFTIETHDGAVIYVVGSGRAYSSEDTYERALKGDLPATIPTRAALYLATVHPSYLWVNRLQFIEIGEMVRARSEVNVDLYALK
jgi:hypothetical protein